MTEDEIKQFIADKTSEGLSLSQIQDALSAQGVKMRFMELRLLASEIESVLEKKEAEKAVPTEKKEEPSAENAPEGEEEPFPGESAPADAPAGAPGLRGKTSVTVSPIQRPGFMASGTVSFGSGASADWYLDQTGRIGLDNASGKPDQQDLAEFQVELRKAFGA